MKRKPAERPTILLLVCALMMCCVFGAMTSASDQRLSTASCSCSSGQAWYPIPTSSCASSTTTAKGCGTGSCGTGSCACVTKTPNAHHIPSILPQKESSYSPMVKFLACVMPESTQIRPTAELVHPAHVGQAILYNLKLQASQGTRAPPA